ncbi:MAG: dienelactone hydrolase family protein [Candidatus Aminicenantes bacterium]|nr:MAG: dienelactone hydrolase family protein [Candidatus Aminicenantes bacterium]
MKNKRVTIPLAEDERVSGILSIPENFEKEKGSGVIIAHGAGNDMNNPMLVSFAEGLANAGYLAMRFNFPYKEKGKKAPDPPKKLDQTWVSVFEYFRKESGFSHAKIFAAGKSMGGRIASQLVAEGKLPVGRLILLGYPLHPPGQKKKLRDAHLPGIKVPMLFFAGTRDSLCDLELLKNVLGGLKIPWALEVIEGGDHSFKVPKSYDIPEREVYNRILNKAIEWFKSDS